MGLRSNASDCIFRKYFTFSGRASRREFWQFAFVVALGVGLPGLMGAASLAAEYKTGGDDPLRGLAKLTFALIAGFLLLAPFISASARRLNDLGAPGLIAPLIWAAPMLHDKLYWVPVAALVLFTYPGLPHSTVEGPPPRPGT